VSAIAGRDVTFLFIGGESSLGHPLQYQVEVDGYFVPAARTTWTAAFPVGTHVIRVRAFCALDGVPLSEFSQPLRVVVQPSSSTSPRK